MSNLTEQFVIESNRIEGIIRPPTDIELEEHERFMTLDYVSIFELVHFVSIYDPSNQRTRNHENKQTVPTGRRVHRARRANPHRIDPAKKVTAPDPGAW